MGVFSLICLIVFGIFTSSTQAQSEHHIRALSYYEAPPFYHHDGSGLVSEIVDAINQETQSAKLNYKVFTRPIIDRMLEETEHPVVILLVNPYWFMDMGKTKYNWTTALYSDSNALISHINDPVEFEGEETFLGQSVAVIKKHRFKTLDKLVEEGKASRLEMFNVETIVKRIEHKRARLGIIPFAAAQYHVSQNNLSDKIYFSEKSQNTFERYLLMKNVPDNHFKELEKAVLKIKKSGKLDQILKKYGY